MMSHDFLSLLHSLSPTKCNIVNESWRFACSLILTCIFALFSRLTLFSLKMRPMCLVLPLGVSLHNVSYWWCHPWQQLLFDCTTLFPLIPSFITSLPHSGHNSRRVHSTLFLNETPNSLLIHIPLKDHCITHVYGQNSCLNLWKNRHENGLWIKRVVHSVYMFAFLWTRGLKRLL